MIEYHRCYTLRKPSPVLIRIIDYHVELGFVYTLLIWEILLQVDIMTKVNITGAKKTWFKIYYTTDSQLILFNLV